MTEVESFSRKSPNEVLADIIQKNSLPTENDFLKCLHDEHGIFYETEGVLHDYKDEYPHSVSDEYFSGILRLICAFHNTYGGIILFGIHDEKRIAGKNKVMIDPEKVNRRLRECLTFPIQISYRKYDTPSGAVDVVLIPKRNIGTPPVRFSQPLGKYSSTKVFRRFGAEVLEASGSDIEFLYGPRSNPFTGIVEPTNTESALPGSPATINEFVGRFEVVEKVADWLTTSRESRLFLWGHGGSGKSTIAYECAKIIAATGKSVKNKVGKTFDRVVYLTAKQKFLDPYSAKIQDYGETDFQNAMELYKKILTLSRWQSAEEIEKLSEDQVLNDLEELFNIETQFIIIDDIDTLAGLNEDFGMEQLFGITARCQSGTKILYTQRNLPVYARKSSVEIPGLSEEEELPNFISLCSKQFNVPMPTKDEQSKIALLSERRPLAVETIMGLRRMSENYDAAMKRWSGDLSEAREYLFQREYDQLSKENRGRYLLAVISAFGKPQTLKVLQQILNFSDEQMQDAVAETRDMFLKVTYGNDGGDDLYTLGAATNLFIAKASEKLDRYPTIVAKVRNFLSTSKVAPPALLVLIERANRRIEDGDAETAWTFLGNPELPPALTEHHAFKAVIGRAASRLMKPKITEAREAFEAAFALGHRDYQMYVDWLKMERTIDAGTTNGILVCKKVVETAGFSLRTKAHFYRQLAYLQMRRSIDLQASSPDESEKLRDESLFSNLNAYFCARTAGDSTLQGFLDQVIDSIGKRANFCARAEIVDQFIKLCEQILSLNECMDDIAPSLISRLEWVVSRTKPDAKEVVRRNMARLAGRFNQKDFGLFERDTAKQAFTTRIRQLAQSTFK